MDQSYQAPAIEERTDVAVPLNATATSSNPAGFTPEWRRPEPD
jgi:hypothetical protein